MSDVRIALFSDVHGNAIALDAVLDNIDSCGGVDEYWIIGDHAALGPDPVAVIERLRSLPNAYHTRGNTDRYTVQGDRPRPDAEEILRAPELLPRLLEVTASFSWTQGAVTEGGQLDWLGALEVEHRSLLPDGTHVLGV